MHVLSRALVAPAAAALVLTGLALPAHASATANEIVYTKLTDAGQSIVLRDLTSRRDTVVLPTTATTDYDYPELSLQGDKVVADFDELTAADINNVGIVVANRDGSGVKRLTSQDTDATASYDTQPTFSPDGQTVLFTRITATNPDAPTAKLMTVPADGSAAATDLPGGAGGAGGAYSPSGTTIVFSNVTDFDTGEGTLTTVTGGTPTSLGIVGKFPKYSPDGSTIAFARSVDTNHDEIATAQGSTVTSLGSPFATSFSDVVGWLPDGQSLVYDVYSSRGFEVWGVNPTDKRHGAVITATTTSDASSGFAQGPAPASVETLGAASTFVPVEPTRLLDTRGTNGGHPGKLTAGEAFALQVEGRTLNGGGTIPDIASAVLNVTVTGNSTANYLQVYPAPVSPAPTTSSLNTTAANQTRANQVTVSMPSANVSVRNSAGTADVIVDITGYYLADGTGALFGAVTPKRILDTRSGLGAAKAAVGPGGTVDLLVRGGSTGVPADATAVTLNVTGTASTGSTNVKVYPKPESGNAVPNVSSLNVARDETAPNLVTVKIGAGGYVRLQNAVGSVQLIADVAGYYGGTSATATYQAVTPARFLDTRTGLGAAPILTSASAGVDVLLRGYRGLPDAVYGVVLNVTGTSVSAATNVRAYPSGTTQPTVSSLNLVPGDSRANAVVASPGSNGRVRVANAAGNVHLIADVAGYFATAVS